MVTLTSAIPTFLVGDGGEKTNPQKFVGQLVWYRQQKKDTKQTYAQQSKWQVAIT